MARQYLACLISPTTEINFSLKHCRAFKLIKFHKLTKHVSQKNILCSSKLAVSWKAICIQCTMHVGNSSIVNIVHLATARNSFVSNYSINFYCKHQKMRERREASMQIWVLGGNSSALNKYERQMQFWLSDESL